MWKNLTTPNLHTKTPEKRSNYCGFGRKNVNFDNTQPVNISDMSPLDYNSR